MRSILAVAAVLGSSLVCAAPAVPTPSLKVERRDSLEASVVREMNRIRVAHGLHALRASPSLRSAARGHSESMLERGFFGHDSADGTAFSERIRRHYTSSGWQEWSVGEALLASPGQAIEAKAIVEAWLESPTHREIVLSPEWRDAGIGALYAPTAPREYGGSATIVVTADFGLRDGRVNPA